MKNSVALALCALVVATFAIQAQTAPAAKTSLVAFSSSRMRIAQTSRGSCWTESIASNRSDAYRCIVGNLIFDPCFTRAPQFVACPTDVLGNRGTLISLTKPLPRHAPVHGPPAPWAFALRSGALCRLGTGTINPMYPYYCSAPPVCSAPKRSSAAPGLFVSRCGRPQNQITVTSVITVDVTAIWK